jgi:hypothetical protein
MRMQVEPTAEIVVVDGIPCRLWAGVTKDGCQAILFVHRIAVPEGQDTSEFDRELLPVHSV